MKLNFRVSEPANLFHIVDSLSNWDNMNTREGLRNWYIVEFGMSGDDEQLLKYVDVRAKHPWGELDNAFVPARSYSDALRRAEAMLSKPDFETIVETMEYFREHAGIMYRHVKPDLLTRKKSLEQEIQNHDLSNVPFMLSSFYASSSVPKNVTAHLLVNTCDGFFAGGSNVKKGWHITIEPDFLGKEKQEYIFSDILIGLHEIVHLFERRADKPKSRQYHVFLEKEGIDELDGGILEEAIADSLSHGALSTLYGFEKEASVLEHQNIPVTPRSHDLNKYYASLRAKLAAHLYPSTMQQIELGDSVFSNGYIEQSVKLLKSLRQS